MPRIEIEAIVLAIILALLGGAFWLHGEREFAKGEASVRAEYDRKLLERVAEVRKEEAGIRAGVEKAREEDLVRARVAEAAAGAVRSERDRLRLALAGTGSNGAAPGTRTGADDPATLKRIVDACASRYEAVAGDARSDADKVIGLQNYIRAALTNGGHPQVEGEGQRAGFSGPGTQPSTAPSPSTPTREAVHP
jgi:hypothetical protein